MQRLKISPYLIPVISLLAVFSVYLMTMPASVFHGDDGETITALATLGIQHPPGYPLHTLLGKIFTLLPLGDVSFRVYFFSGILSLVNFLLIYLFFIRLSLLSGIKSHTALMSAAAGLIFSFGYTIWEQSIIAKGGIYTLNLLFTILLTHIIFSIYNNPERKNKYLYLFSLIFGLSLTHHHMSQELLSPLYAFFLYKSGAFKKLTIKTVLFCALFFFSAVTAYCFLPFRADTALLNWGQPSTMENFIRVVTRWQYLRGEITRSLSGSLSQIWKYMTSVTIEYAAAGILFLIPGLAALYRRDKNIFAYLSGIALFFLAITAVYLNLSKDRLFIMETYITPAYFPLSVFIAIGIYHTAARLNAMFRINTTALILIFSGALIGAQLYYGAPRLDKSSYFMAYDYNRNIFDSLEKNSILFNTGDGIVFPSWYFKYARHYRADVTLVGSAVLPMKWVRDSISRQNPAVAVPRPSTENIGTESTGYIINALIKMNYARMPVYFSYNKPEDNALGTDLKIVPRGIVQKVLPAEFARPSPQYVKMQENIWKFYNLRGVFDRRSKYSDLRAVDIYIKDYSVSLNSAGTFCEDNGLNELSLKYFTLAHYFYPSDHEYIYNMGNAHYNLGNIKGSIDFYRKCVSMEPKYESGWFNLGVAGYKTNDYKQALEAFRKVKEINPARTDIDPFIAITEKLVNN